MYKFFDKIKEKFVFQKDYYVRMLQKLLFFYY